MAFLALKVSGSNDNARQRATSGSSFSTSGDLLWDAGTATTGDWISGCRFTNVTIAPGSTIDSAIPGLRTTSTDDPNCDIYCEDVDSAVDFATSATLTGRTKTTASVQWDDNNVGTNTDVVGPDIKTAVQEVIDRAGWASGNALMMLGQGRKNDNRGFSFRNYNTVSTDAAELDITYTEPTSEPVDLAADLTATGALAGAAGVVVGVSGELSGAGALDAAATVVVDAAAGLSGTAALAGAVGVVVDAAAELSAASTLAGSAAVVIGLSGGVTAAGTLDGQLSVVVDVSGALSGTGTLEGAVDVVVDVAGVLSGTGTLGAALADGAIALSASLTGTGALAGDVGVVVSLAGELEASGTLSAALDGTIDLAGNLTASGTLSAAAEVVVDLASDVAGAGMLAAAAGVVVDVAAELAGSGTLQSELDVITPEGLIRPSIVRLRTWALADVELRLWSPVAVRDVTAPRTTVVVRNVALVRAEVADRRMVDAVVRDRRPA